MCFLRLLLVNYRRDRIRGTVCFFLGIVLVLLRYSVVGILIELFGFLNLFGNFLPTVLTVSRQIPGVGYVLDLPLIAPAVDFLAGKTLPKYVV
ncbi:hypothetical protein EON64_08795 [archaeon]|nr:MAG: hypothetical protein EON64_08795 [archaeon]